MWGNCPRSQRQAEPGFSSTPTFRTACVTVIQARESNGIDAAYCHDALVITRLPTYKQHQTLRVAGGPPPHPHPGSHRASRASLSGAWSWAWCESHIAVGCPKADLPPILTSPGMTTLVFLFALSLCSEIPHQTSKNISEASDVLTLNCIKKPQWSTHEVLR